MPRIINSLNEVFIGTVVSYDLKTREIEVYVPMLMPAIARGQSDITLLTNLGRNIDKIEYSKNIKTTSTITAKPRIYQAKMPKPGSLVEISFFNECPDKCYWSTHFDPNNMYEVVDEEKYPFLHSILIGDREIKVDSEDKIEFQFPEGFDFVILEDKDDKKHKIIKLSNENIINERLDFLERQVGVESNTYVNENGEAEEVSASGLYKKIEELQNEVIRLKAKLED